LKERTYRYPGAVSDYNRQAGRFSLWAVFFAAILLLLVFGVDNFLLGQTGLRLDRILMTLLLTAGASGIAFLMARSLAAFTVTVTREGLEADRAGRKEVAAWRDIRGLSAARLPWFWPLRADLKERSKTARHMWRITRRKGPYITFVSGLVEEAELLDTIRERAGLHQEDA
jgi:hypothetical protein